MSTTNTRDAGNDQIIVGDASSAGEDESPVGSTIYASPAAASNPPSSRWPDRISEVPRL